MKFKEESEKAGLKLNIQKIKIMSYGPITSWQIDMETVTDFIFLGSKITADGDWSHEIKTLAPWKKSCDQPRQHIKKHRYYFANEVLYGFFSSHVWMWELNHKESWALKNWCFQTVVLENILESPLNWKEIQPVHPEGNQSWIFIGRTGAEAEAPILWPPDAGKNWRQEKETTEAEIVGCPHWLNGHEFKEDPRNWWWTGKPGMLHFMGSQRVGHDWSDWTELNWDRYYIRSCCCCWLVTKSCLTLLWLHLITCQAPLSMGFPEG